VLLSDVVATSAAVAGSPARRAKIGEIAGLLARVPPGEVTIAVAFLSGELTQRQIGVGYAALLDLPDLAEDPGRQPPMANRSADAPAGTASPEPASTEPASPEPASTGRPGSAGTASPEPASTEPAGAASTEPAGTEPASTGRPGSAGTASPEPVGTAGPWAGDDRPGQGGVAPEAQPVLTLAETDAAFEAIGALSGAGSQAQRRSMLAALLGRATESERQFLFRLLAGDLGQGALEGVMVDAVAQAAGVPAAEVRRAHQLCGSLPEVAQAALTALTDRSPDAQAAGSPTGRPAGSEAGRQRAIAALRAFTLRLGRPVRPMLAASAPSLDAAMSRISPAAVEWKIDGIRIQIHRHGAQVRVFTRTLEDITARVPEIVAIALSLEVGSAVVDGEAVALRSDGRPRPFQVTSARVASQSIAGRSSDRADSDWPAGRGTQADRQDPADDNPQADRAARADDAVRPGQNPTTDQNLRAKHSHPVVLTAYLFDLLYADGESLIDEPAGERFRRLAAISPADVLIPRLVTSDAQEAAEFFRDALGRGHEGVVVKSAEAPYRTGRRGSDWIKVKPRTTLDLVVLAAEWGHGRRRGWLSNLHLGARDPDTGGFVMLGKTFKGLTDAMLAWQTDRLLGLADTPAAPGASMARETEHQYGVVRVRPELVAEIAFDGVQASRRYPGGVTLRFARVLRYRPDKRAEEADTIEMVRALWPEDPAEPEG